MNRRVLIFGGLLLLLFASGGLTSFIAADGFGGLLPILTVTSRPEASVNQFGGSQGLALIGWIAFVVFNLVGASLTGAFLFWFLNREVERAKVLPPAGHATIGDALGLPRGQSASDDDEDHEQELPATT